MNKAAKLVADAVLGDDCKVIVIAGKAYTVRPLTAGQMCRIIQHWAMLQAEDKPNDLMAIKNDIEEILKGISVAIFDDDNSWEELNGATQKEMADAMKAIVQLISAEDFFVCAALAKNVAKMAATLK